MSLSVNGQTGTVGVDQNSVFTVVVEAAAIPQSGYVGAQAWVDFGATGLLPKGNPQVIWPDCDMDTFATGALGDAENSGCLTELGPLPLPVSYYKGALFSFDATCDAFGSSHTIRLISYGDAVAMSSGAAYAERLLNVVPAEHSGDYVADEIVVECEHTFPPSTIVGTLYESQTGVMRGATLTLEPLGIETTSSISDGTFFFLDLSPGSYTIYVKSPTCTPFGCYKSTPVSVSGVQMEIPVSIYPNVDTDGDGCTDVKENGSNEMLGGLRDPTNPWDFYDVSGDRVVELFADVLAVIGEFDPVGYDPGEPATYSPGLKEDYDRGSAVGQPNYWNMTAPDGKIELFVDILGVIGQVFHDCR